MKKFHISPALADVFERGGRTFVQQFLAIAGPGLIVGSLTVPWASATVSALVAAVVSIVTAFASWKVPVLSYWPDVLVRAAKTFGASVVGVLGAQVFLSLNDIPWNHIAETATAATVLSLLTSLLTARIGANSDASVVRTLDTSTDKAVVPPVV